MTKPHDNNQPESADPSRAYRALPNEEPGPALDAAILAAARRETARPARPWFQRWQVPLSVAALVMVSATLTLMVSREERRHEAGPLSSSPDTVTDRASPEPVAKPTAPAPAPPAEGEPAKILKKDRPPESASSPPAVPAPGEVPQAESRAASPTPAPPQEEDPAPRALSKPEPVAPEMLRAPAAAGRSSQELQMEAAASPGDSAETASPDMWIQRILQLQREGKITEAMASLERFKARFPQYSLPPELQRTEEALRQRGN